MSSGHQDMVRLAAQALLTRDFVAEAEMRSRNAIFAACPYGDLTKQEKAAFRSAFEDVKLRQMIERWRTVYDERWQAGVVLQVSDCWDSGLQ